MQVADSHIILTNDSTLNAKILSPKQKIKKKYWVQVEGEINHQALEMLKNGVEIKLAKTIYKTQKCLVLKIERPKQLLDRIPDIRFRKNQATSWIEITLEEGKNRQIRKMLAQVNFPVLRLIRFSIQGLCITDFNSNSIKVLNEVELIKHLRI